MMRRPSLSSGHVFTAWITAEFKNLIRLCQQAFKNGNKESYSLYRNAVNQERKLLCSKYFASKVDNLKSTKPSQWWNAVNRIAGMVPCASPDSILNPCKAADQTVSLHEHAEVLVQPVRASSYLSFLSI